MTAIQKLKWAILARDAQFNDKPAPEYPCENVDELYEMNDLSDAEEEIRGSGVATNLKCEFSRHYESESRAMKMPDGSWVGWTYWYGGGKHGEPQGVLWIGYAYDVDCVEEEKMMIVRTFNKRNETK